MGIAVLMDVFVMAAPWMRYVLGPLLIAYGIFRAYRQIRLRDYSRYDDDSDDSQSATAHYDDTDK